MTIIGKVKEFFAKISQRYAAAKDYPFAHFPSGRGYTDENREVADSWTAVTGRTQQLVRDFPPFASAVNNLVAYQAGDGFRFQSLARLPDGTPDRDSAQQIEEAFIAWQHDCDESGTLSFMEMQQLWRRQILETGDAIIRKYVNDRGRLKLKVMNPASLGFGLSRTNNPVFMGIEYDQATMKRLRYWFFPTSSTASALEQFQTDATSIPADEILHGFDTKSPDQMRGISPFASAILLCSMARDYMQAELATQQIHSKFTAFVTTPSVGQGSQWDKAEYDRVMKGYSEQIKYGTMEFLRPGQTITLNNVQRSATGVKDFLEMVLRMVAASSGCTYQMVAENYTGLNYTVTKSSMNSFKQRLKVVHSSTITRLLRPTFVQWLDLEHLSGRMNLPYYWSRRSSYLRHKWIPPGIESVDPMKDAQAAQVMIEAGLMSPQEAIMSQGRDPDMVISELAEWKQQLKEAKITELWMAGLAQTLPKVNPTAKTTQTLDNDEVENG